MGSNNLGPGSRRPRSRLRKRKGTTLTLHRSIPRKFTSLRVVHPSSFSRGRYRYRGDGPLYGGLHKAWVGYAIAKSQVDFEKMRKYAMVIQKFERRLNIEINEFPELGLYASDAFNNKEEDDDSKLAVIDPWTEKIQDAKKDEDDCKEVDFDSL